MAFDLEEQEKIDEAKAWWNRHGNKVIWGVTLFLLLVAGWRGWETWTRNQQAEASMLFDRAVQAARQNDTQGAKTLAAQIMDNQSWWQPGWRAYGAPAAWLAGRISHDAGDAKSARAQYEFALAHAVDESTRQIARLRLATLLLDQDEPDAALKQLETPFEPAFLGLAAQLKGDIHVARGDADQARAAYKLALETLSEASAFRSFVEARLDSLGG